MGRHKALAPFRMIQTVGLYSESSQMIAEAGLFPNPTQHQFGIGARAVDTDNLHVFMAVFKFMDVAKHEHLIHRPFPIHITFIIAEIFPE